MAMNVRTDKALTIRQCAIEKEVLMKNRIDPELQLKQYLDKHFPLNEPDKTTPVGTKGKSITMPTLIEARQIAAKFVELYGEDYLPFFERLDKEVKMKEKKEVQMQNALQFARS